MFADEPKCLLDILTNMDLKENWNQNMKAQVRHLEGGKSPQQIKPLGKTLKKGSHRPFRCPLTLGMFLHATHSCPKPLRKRKK
jgi:uncharacterized protein HemY